MSPAHCQPQSAMTNRIAHTSGRCRPCFETSVPMSSSQSGLAGVQIPQQAGIGRTRRRILKGWLEFFTTWVASNLAQVKDHPPTHPHTHKPKLIGLNPPYVLFVSRPMFKGLDQFEPLTNMPTCKNASDLIWRSYHQCCCSAIKT